MYIPQLSIHMHHIDLLKNLVFMYILADSFQNYYPYSFFLHTSNGIIGNIKDMDNIIYAQKFKQEWHKNFFV